MAEVVELTDTARIETHFRRHLALHIYELGDLDPFFLPHCRFFGLQDGERLRSVLLVYDAPGLPCVLALGRDDDSATAQLFAAIQPDLPSRYYAHLAPGLAEVPTDRVATPHGRYLKMVLDDPAGIASVPTPDAEPIALEHKAEIEDFYKHAYPGNWFDQRMLQTGQYFGVRRDGRWVSVAGIHVYSPAQRVAALGNIATDPAHRGHGLGRQVTARVCASLLGRVQTVGLNVNADNPAALSLYRNLGFKTVAPYEEWAFCPS